MRFCRGITAGKSVHVRPAGGSDSPDCQQVYPSVVDAGEFPVRVKAVVLFPYWSQE